MQSARTGMQLLLREGSGKLRFTAPPPENGFSLIELLVVVAIIVLLLSLLVPAMDRAIYRAELVQCSANLDTMATGVTAYAMASKRFYPDRGLANRTSNDTNPLPVNPFTVKRFSVSYDIRPLHREIFPINKTLQCPMSPAVELEDYSTENEDVGLDASYAMFWAWQFKEGSVSYSGMFKYGSKFSYLDLEQPNSPALNKFNVLAGDIDLAWNTGAQASHSDSDGVLSELAVDKEWFIERITVGRWAGPHARGTLDNNFAFDDGSAATYEKITRVDLPWNHPDRNDQIARIPINFNNFNNRGTNVDKMQIPKR